MQHLCPCTKTYSLFCLLFCCSPNLDDITHILQTFHWSLPINIYLFGEWWDIFQPTFIGQSYHLKSNKVPWGLWNSWYMIWMQYYVLCTLFNYDLSPDLWNWSCRHESCHCVDASVASALTVYKYIVVLFKCKYYFNEEILN